MGVFASEPVGVSAASVVPVGQTQSEAVGAQATACTGAPRTPPPFGTPEPLATRCMTLQVGQRQVSPGEVFSVPVWMIRGARVANVNYEVRYDGSVVRAEPRVATGTFFRSALHAANTDPPGLIRVGRSQARGESGTGTISHVKFRAVGTPGQSTSLTLVVTTIDNPGGTHLRIDTIAGRIDIVSPETRPAGGCPPNDGVADAADAICALQMSVGLRSLDQVMDVDRDAAVTSSDASLLLREAAVAVSRI
jgi:hypothetical protein